MQVKAYASYEAGGKLSPFIITRRSPFPHDVVVEILRCGICHSDLHKIRNDWNDSHYPIVPGHEIIGRVKSIGTNVSKFKIGDIVGIGCIVYSCRTCDSCTNGEEQFCETQITKTYDSIDQFGEGYTYGGYSTFITVNENFVLKISHQEKDLSGAAPLLCAGITLYSPLKFMNVTKGSKVAITGIGGLGHLGIKFASAMGANVTAFTSCQSKAQEAINLGAQESIITSQEFDFSKYSSMFDLIIDTIPNDHSIDGYIKTLRRDGTIVVVGLISNLKSLNCAELVRKRKSIMGSFIGSIGETQEMLDFAAKKNIVADIEEIDIQYINEAFIRMEKGDVKYRFVINMNSFNK